MVVMVEHQAHSQTLVLVVEEEVLRDRVQELVDLVDAVVEVVVIVVVVVLDLVILVHLPITIIYHMVTLHLMVGDVMVVQTHFLAA